MISTSKPHKSVRNILYKPAEIIPQLSQEEIQILLIQTIKLYRKHNITLETLVKCTANIKRYKNVALTSEMQKIIEEIQSFYTVDSVLSDILQELKADKRKKGISHE